MNLPSHEWPRHLTPDQKVTAIEKQLANIEAGNSEVLECPYCDAKTFRGDTLCCLTMGKAVRAILQRQTTQELADTAARIADAVSRN